MLHLGLLLILAPPPAGAVVADLVELLTGAEQRDMLARARGGGFKIAGRRLLGIDHHPQHPGAGRAQIEYPAIGLPAVGPGERLLFVAELAIREGFDRAANPQVDGVEFVVLIGATELLRQRQREQEWQPVVVDLGRWAGQTVTITLATECGANSNYDWAVWGRPRILVEGREPAPGALFEPYLDITELLSRPEPDRISEVHQEGAATTLIAVLDEQLDLATQLARLGGEVTPLVPLGPALVVGEGAHPDNHTVVKILNRYGISRVQFLAYPPAVRGGVQVECGQADGRPFIVTAPISDAGVREIRVFDGHGGPLAVIDPPGLDPPYTIAVGRFGRGPGDLLAVASQSAPPARFAVFRANGEPVGTGNLQPPEATGPVRLLRAPGAERDGLLLHFADTGFAATVTLGDQELTAERRGLPRGAAIHGAADGRWVVATADESRSTVRLLGDDGELGAEIDLGREENRFWYAWPAAATGWDELPPIPDSEHVRRCDYRHLRVDARPAAAREPEFDNLEPDYWAGPDYVEGLRQANLLPDLTTVPPAIWEPCFTHRQFKELFARWHEAVDPATGLARYVSLSRRNRPVEYGEFGRVDFVASTYAQGLPALDNLYLLPLRQFLRHLAPRFREHPDRLVAIEPNHEHEIAIDRDHTIGDYNPANIAGFFTYLTRLYGWDLGAVNHAMRTNFIDRFDAPRWEGRGAWDEYDEANPFFWQWGLYNRYVVNLRLAETFREALLAGFPPELIKSHQIPDLYAIGGGLEAFSDVADRITPLDYAMTAGVGFGFTKYGVWHEREHNIGQAARDSGFDLTLIGEYQALTPDPEQAYAQLRYLFDNGVQQVHCMTWPEGHDNGFNRTMHQALAWLAAEDPPRPGVTGGVGQIRPYRDGERASDLVSLGTGSRQTGLIKSVRADGSFEGTVYVVPFHAHVSIATEAEHARLTLDRPLEFGPFNGLDGGVQFELTFRAAGAGRLRYLVAHAGRELPGLGRELAVHAEPRGYRLILRAQLPAEGIELRLEPVGGAIELTDLRLIRHADQTVRVHRGQLDGRRHAGGVTFAVLPPG